MKPKEFNWDEYREFLKKTNIPLKKSMKEKLNKPSITFKELIKKLECEIVDFNKKDVLYWLTTTSILPGNEIYKNRFLLLKQLTLSIPNSKFKNKKFNDTSLKKILTKTQLFNWYIIEDYKPVSNSISNLFIYEGKKYYFLPGSLEYPELLLEKISTRYIEFEKDLDFSIKNEFKKILKYHTKIIKFIEKNKRLIKNIDGFVLPTDGIVNDFKKIIDNQPNFSKKLFPNYEKIVPKPDSNKNFDEFFTDHPIVNNKIYSQSELLYSFDKKLSGKLKNKYNDEIKEKIKNQLGIEILGSLLEVAIINRIPVDFSLNSSDKIIDFGLQFDNKFLLIFMIDETFDSGELNKKILSLIKISNELKKEFSKKPLIIKFEEETIKIDKELDPIFLIITDELADIRITPFRMPQEDIFILTCNCLRHIFEDLADMKKTPIYFIKILEFFKYFSKFTFIQSLTFCDFYEMLAHGESLDGGVLNTDIKNSKKPNIMIVDPHNWSENQRKRVMIRRPRIDLRPPGYKTPFTFKIIKFSENRYAGYNHFIDQEFYCFINDYFEVYVLIDKKKFTIFNDKRKIDIFEDVVKFLQNYLLTYFEEFLDYDLIGKARKKKIIIEIVSIEWGEKKKIIQNNKKGPLMVGNPVPNKFIILIDPLLFSDTFGSDSKGLLFFFTNEILSKLVGKDQYKKILKKFMETDPSESFKITRIFTYTTKAHGFCLIPEKFDIAKTDLIISNHFKKKFSPGLYKGDNAKKIIDDIYNFLVETLITKISDYDIEKFVNFCYEEIERARRIRIESTLDFRLSQGLKIEYNNKEILEEEIDKMNLYSPACRYLLEQALSFGINGDKEINIIDWQEICPIAMKMLIMASVSDYIYHLSDHLDVKIEVNFIGSPKIDIIIENNPIEKYKQQYIEGLRELDISNFLINENRKNNMSSDGLECSPTNQTLLDVIKKSNEVINEDSYLNKISKELESAYGFSLNEYHIVLNTLTHIEINERGLINIPYSNLINFVYEKTKIDTKIIKNVINFSTLLLDGPNGKIVEHWKVNSRKEKITIKPLIKINEHIIFGKEALVFAIDKVFFSFLEGKSAIPIEHLPIGLIKSLDSLQNKSSKNFELEVFNKIKKNSDKCQKNLCQNYGENKKCLSFIKEPCPGEMDIISIHKKEKYLILWEVKNIEPKYGSRDICNTLEKFVNKKNGFMKKLKIKEEYLRRNINDILKYYNLKESDTWNVKSCFILSNDNIFQYILEQKIDIINFLDVQDYINELTNSS